ncbi:MAG: phosphoribosylformimino-5-aminoimidazole carboxamide ribotide isomerase [Akkermansia sp.]
MTHFRPCIDLHHGHVKQIVGGTLSNNPEELHTNFVSDHSAAWFAQLYQRDQLTGGHIIKLGPGNDQAALDALSAWHGGMQLGGGITANNAEQWIQSGASHVIVTSSLFSSEGIFLKDRLKDLVHAVGADRLVIDLSCRKTPTGWVVAMNRWQTLTNLSITPMVLDDLAEHCAEFLIHAADVEGLCRGIDEELVTLLGSWHRRPMTYAGGIGSMDDFQLIDRLSGGNIDATVGSALDIFGGKLIRYADLVQAQRTDP